MGGEDNSKFSPWNAMPPAQLSPLADFDRPLVPLATPEKAPRPKRPIAAPKLEKRRAGALPWIIAAFVAWIALVGGRTQIVRLLPGAAPAYAALGMAVNLREMDILGVTSKLVDEDGRKILLVEGEIRNLSSEARTPPRMRLAVLDAKGAEIYFWTAAPAKSRLNAGEKAFFRARLAAPPDEGAEVRVRFVPDQARAS